jgi:hypothetical protein
MNLDDKVGSLYSCGSALKPENIPIDTSREDKAGWNLGDIASIWVVISMSIVSGMNVTRTRRRIRFYSYSRGLGRSHARYEWSAEDNEDFRTFCRRQTSSF